MTARCDLTDLVATECAHCRGLDKPQRQQGQRDLGPWFFAQYGGECGECGDEFEQGSRIRADGEGGWLAECCGTEPQDDDPLAGLLIL